jgi:hypothetical protein
VQNILRQNEVQEFSVSRHASSPTVPASVADTTALPA